MILSSTKQKDKSQTHTFSTPFLMPNFTLSLLMALLSFLGTTLGYAQSLDAAGGVRPLGMDSCSQYIAVSLCYYLLAPFCLLHHGLLQGLTGSLCSQVLGAPLPPPSALIMLSVGLLLTHFCLYSSLPCFVFSFS